MKARKKNSNDEWKDVIYIQLRDSYWTSEDQIEFQYENLFTELKTYAQVDEKRHWQDVRERAAIAALNGLLADSSCDGSMELMVKGAIDFANELVRQLKGK